MAGPLRANLVDSTPNETSRKSGLCQLKLFGEVLVLAQFGIIDSKTYLSFRDCSSIERLRF